MPELPEVEHVRCTLIPHLLGSTLTVHTVNRPDVIRAVDGRRHSRWSRSLRAGLFEDARITRLSRIGKHLWMTADDGRVLDVHLGMTGRLTLVRPGVSLAGVPHIHVQWHLSGRRTATFDRLIFQDPRRFGCLRPFADEERHREVILSRLGPDALGITKKDLEQRLSGRGRPVKAALLDQQILAGLGNIYADESLFRAQVHPRTPCSKLGALQYRRLANSIRQVLRQAIEHDGTTLRDYIDLQGKPGRFRSRLRVYGRAGQPCYQCGEVLTSLQVAQRTTVCCQFCQPEA